MQDAKMPSATFQALFTLKRKGEYKCLKIILIL
jgi:hypothetical protein